MTVDTEDIETSKDLLSPGESTDVSLKFSRSTTQELSSILYTFSEQDGSLKWESRGSVPSPTSPWEFEIESPAVSDGGCWWGWNASSLKCVRLTLTVADLWERETGFGEWTLQLVGSEREGVQPLYTLQDSESDEDTQRSYNLAFEVSQGFDVHSLRLTAEKLPGPETLDIGPQSKAQSLANITITNLNKTSGECPGDYVNKGYEWADCYTINMTVTNWDAPSDFPGTGDPRTEFVLTTVDGEIFEYVAGNPTDVSPGYQAWMKFRFEVGQEKTPELFLVVPPDTSQWPVWGQNVTGAWE